MSSSKKKIGRPRIDSEAVNVRLDRHLLDPLDAWRAEQPSKPGRAEAIRLALRDWLAGLGRKGAA